MRTSDAATEDDAIPVRSVLLWSLVGIVVITGIILYFKYERQLTPIVG